MAEAQICLSNVEEDNICLAALQIFEENGLMSAEEDELLLQIPDELFSSNNALPPPAPMPLINVPNPLSAQDLIQQAYSRSPIARVYLEDHFYAFTMWPEYMVNLFVTKNIQNYSYSDRNKICLFFWGNGATFEVMETISHYFAPPPTMITAENVSSRNKCRALFNTYTQQRLNPAYAQRYYYFNIHEGRMLFIDGRPRHYGHRQENTVRDRFPSWY